MSDENSTEYQDNLQDAEGDYDQEQNEEQQEDNFEGQEGEGGEEEQVNNAGDDEHGEEQERTTNGADDASKDDSSALGSRIGAKGDDDDKKIFVGGLHWESTAVDIKDYFSKFGKVVDCTLKIDQNTGKSRGFGFVLFDSAEIVQKILADKSHTLHGKAIDCKPALSKASNKAEPIKKVFVGGLSPDMPESDIREYFSQYGKIEEIDLPFDKSKNQRRAFCFITFETEDMVDKCVASPKQKVGDKEVDIRKATPMQKPDPFRNQNMRGPAPYGGYAGYPGYDYSAYYGAGGPYAGYGYPGYGPPGYDYSGYYAQGGDWAAYGGYGYPGYDYSAYYGAQSQQGGAGGGGSGGFKSKRGGSSSSGGGYHPYSR